MLRLHHDQEVAKPTTFEEDLAPVDVSSQERELAKSLVEAFRAKEFTPAQYKDAYTEKLTQLIEAKVAGQDIVAPPYEEQAPIINLMDALRESLARTQQRTNGVPSPKVSMTNGKESRCRKRKTS